MYTPFCDWMSVGNAPEAITSTPPIAQLSLAVTVQSIVTEAAPGFVWLAPWLLVLKIRFHCCVPVAVRLGNPESPSMQSCTMFPDALVIVTVGFPELPDAPRKFRTPFV